MKQKIDIFESDLVPKHEILSESEKLELLERLKTKLSKLPRIKESDPCVKILNAKKFDVIKITRISDVAGKNIYYRVVV